jgi:tetratricopeptide (TPR) repeat protein
MTRTIPTPLVAVLAFAALACGGDKPKATVTSAEAHGVTPVTAVTPPTNVDPRTVTTPAFESADAAYKAGDFKVAAELYKTRVDSAPDDAFGQYMLGLSSWKAGDFKGAKAAFDKSIELDSTNAKAYFNEARVLLDMKRVPEAVAVIEKGRAIDSTSSDGFRLIARAKADGGDTEGALATYRQLLVRDETDAWGLNNYGMLFFHRAEIADALGPVARAVELRPTAPVFLNNLGMVLEALGYPVAALHRYELAVQNDSTYVKAVKNVDRLKPAVTDSTLVDEVDVKALADQFRLKVQGWKTEVPKS